MPKTISLSSYLASPTIIKLSYRLEEYFKISSCIFPMNYVDRMCVQIFNIMCTLSYRISGFTDKMKVMYLILREPFYFQGNMCSV